MRNPFTETAKQNAKEAGEKENQKAYYNRLEIKKSVNL